MTVKELLKECKLQIEEGNGDKVIWISKDDEGNGYHELFYSFDTDVKDLDWCQDIDDPDNAIILG